MQARTDPAVRLELAGDHHEALIAVRFDDDPTIDHLQIVARLERYLTLELRRALWRVDTAAPGVSPVTRSLGRGVLAIDARERVLRICARSGRPLDATEALAVERVARQAATIPAADPARLEGEIAASVRDFVARHPFALGAAEVTRLIAAVGALGDGASLEDVRVAVATAYGGRLSDAILRSTADSLARRIAAVRRRHIAATNFRDMLAGAQLPTEGVLADEVRSATLEAMGPVVGIPAPADSPTAHRLDLVPIGGAPNDRALSQLWRRALGASVVAVAASHRDAARARGGADGGAVAAAGVRSGGRGDRAGGAAGRAGGVADALVLRGRTGRRRDPRARGHAAGAPGSGAGPRVNRSWWRALPLLVVCGCGAPPWRLGAPLDGRPSIPPDSAVATPAQSADAAAQARASGRRVLEIAALMQLDTASRLTRAARDRLVELLTARATEFHALGRAIPESADLETVARLTPYAACN